MFCTKLDAMAFLPVTDVPEAFASLGDDAPDGTEGLVEYFSTNCLNGTFRRVQTTGEDGAISINMRRLKPRIKKQLGFFRIFNDNEPYCLTRALKKIKQDGTAKKES